RAEICGIRQARGDRVVLWRGHRGDVGGARRRARPWSRHRPRASAAAHRALLSGRRVREPRSGRYRVGLGAGPAHPQPPRRPADHRERTGTWGDIHRPSAPGHWRGGRVVTMQHRRQKVWAGVYALIAGIVAAAAPVAAADISGAGSTFAYPIYSAWA